MTKYKVIQQGPLKLPQSDSTHLAYAQQMKDQYGLPHDLETIILMWEDYSDSFAAGWLISDKESIEIVFNVTLEEIQD